MTEQTYDVSTYMQGFRDNLTNTPQQMKSRLLPCVMSDLNYATPGTSFNIDIVGEGAGPKSPKSKMAFLEPREIGEGRRGAYFAPVEDYFHVANFDLVRLAADPSSRKMADMMAKKELDRDSVIVSAAFGTTYSTDTTGALVTANTFPAAQTIAVDDRDYLHAAEKTIIAASGNIGLTVGKVIKAKGLLNKSEILGEEDYFVVTTELLNQLLTSTAATSSDYAMVKALINGEITQWMGFTWVRYEKLTVASSIVDALAFRKSALEYRERPIAALSIKQRDDLSGLPWQYYYQVERAAARVFDTGVVKVRATQVGAYA